ncbi:MAG: response regulator [Chitinophagaceae bacterium]|nr:MAG: response regulator [Chitinophagaceae bacterium]
MKTWKTIIIDDEPLARQRLKRLLKPFDHIDIIGEAENGQDGLERISGLNPDLVFLDIEMPVLNGFEMLARLTKQPRVVFTTAYDQYAIKAFEENSVDYLLKPIEGERLEKTISKLEKINDAMPGSVLEAMIRQIRQPSQSQTITVKSGDRIILVKHAEISYLQAEEKYVSIVTVNGKKYLTDLTLSSLEEKLPASFVRIHRACIINSDQIKEITKGFNGVFNFVLHNHENNALSSSRSNNDYIRERFDI